MGTKPPGSFWLLVFPRLASSSKDTAAWQSLPPLGALPASLVNSKKVSESKSLKAISIAEQPLCNRVYIFGDVPAAAAHDS
ncbi:hypothetical protein D5086_011809 [Populus alba]|uniref:Uncharacterized protein n=1 Tax=Populus alba TaxID=43335 RepID=A0ACC4C264_POPAL